MRILTVFLMLAALTACGAQIASSPSVDVPRPATAGTTAPPPPADARTVDQFDTTTAEERAEVIQAATAPRSAEVSLGTTVASLGNPAEPGFWLETALVDDVAEGRVLVPSSGATVAVELRPIGRGAGAGSRMSLAAMRLLELPLTGLPEVEVFRR